MPAKKFSLAVDMIEDSMEHYLSVNHQDKIEYFFKNNKGLLRRKSNEIQESISTEWGSLKTAENFFPKSLKLKLDDTKGKDFQFDPGKITRDHRYLLYFLANLKLPAWQVVFRAYHARRCIILKESKQRDVVFKHFSILIKLFPTGNRRPIELGEGSTREAKFNLDGLKTRITEIIENDRNSKHISFRDRVPVILGPGDGAILFHEILGHSLEADYMVQGISPLSPGDIGKEIVSPNVTLVTGDKKDDFFRDVPYDDEGESTKPVTLVKNGILKNVIADTFYRDLLGLKTAGFARVKDFTRTPMPRMFALYLKPGSLNPGELFESTPYGLYAKEFGAGKVHFDRKMFNFNIEDAYLVENGKLSVPLGRVVVRGNILDTLNSIDMIADDFRYDKGISYCYKNGQTINVRVGQPSVKIRDLYVTDER